MLKLPKQPRILITRLSAIGDCVHTVPLVSALRHAFPDAYIAWATQKINVQLLDGVQGLDEVLELDRNWMKHPSGFFQTRRDLLVRKFDISIDPQSLTKSSLLGWLSDAKHRIGFAKGQGRELSPWLSSVRVTPKEEHVVDRYLELLRPLGVEPRVEFGLPRFSDAADAMREFLTQNGLQDFILINPGAGWPSKQWPHLRYAEVANHLAKKHGLKSVVLWAGERERTWATEIVAASQECSVLAPDTTLRELSELARLSRLFVGSDTGPMHLAAAVGTRCVALYGPTRPSVCGPYAHGDIRHESIQVRYQDGTSQQRRGNDNSAMREIGVHLVADACDRLLTLSSKKVA